jgi:hypothetical protein
MSLLFARHSTLLYKAGSLLALGAVVLLYNQAGAAVLAAYNAACAINDRFFAGSMPVGFDQALLIFLLPTLLARANLAVKVSLALALFTLLMAILTMLNANTPPYECVTMGGSYEDHSSVASFELYVLLFLFLSYLFLVIDWSSWLVFRLVRD